MRADGLTPEDRLRYARVLLEAGEPYHAEAQLAAFLEARPDDLGGLDLLARIKHQRGELSEAIALWAQVVERSPRHQSGLLRLSSLLQMARDTEREGREFLVLGHFQLWRKPAVHLELEDVFRTFLARRPDAARERCDQIARKYQGRDPDTYKLALLAKSWTFELSGEPDAAREVLEQLGRERGFETDADRTLALARLYQQSSAPELLDKAVHIYQFFERSFQKVSVLGHLASLQRRLGRTEEAAGYQSAFLELFHRRMHRVARADAVQVAALVYLPLVRLAGVRFVDTRELEAPTPRERALELALLGDRGAARSGFRAGGELLDRKYLADLASQDASEDPVDLYLDCLRADPEEDRIAEWLLAEYRRTGAERIAECFRDPEVAARQGRRLEAQRRSAPVRASLWRQTEALHLIHGEGELAQGCCLRAAALEEAAQQRRQTVGRVLAAAVYHVAGKARGLIHEVWALRKPAPRGRGGFLEEILGNLTPEMVQAVRNTFLSVREYARAKWPQHTSQILDYGYAYKVTKEDEPSGGLSAGLPTALAFLSVFLDRPVPQDLAASGVLIADAHDVMVLRAVGEAEYKVRGVYNRGLARIILPQANRRDLEDSPLVPRAVCDELVRYASDLDQAVLSTFGPDAFID